MRSVLLILAFSLLFIWGLYLPSLASESDIRFTIANDVSASNWLEFDLLLLDTDPSQDYEMATIQAGILINPACYAGGTLYSIIIPGSSQMASSQAPSSILIDPVQGVIKIASKSPPGCGSGTIISKNPQNPTRLCRVRLSTLSWVTCTTANLTFCFTTTPYPSKISFYSSECINTASNVSTANCYSTALNEPLNILAPAPSAFTVSGSGSFCQGGTGIPVTLSGSESDVVYTLVKNGVAQSPVYNGTGSQLDFGNQTEGTYTVTGKRSVCSGATFLNSVMTGSASIGLNLPTIGGMVTGPDSAVAGITLITLTLNGNVGTVLMWQKRLNGGTWTDIPYSLTAYSEVPPGTGEWEYRAVVRNYDCQIEYSSSKTVEVTEVILDLKLYLESLFNSSTGMMNKAGDGDGNHFSGNIADVIRVELHNPGNYAEIIYTAFDVQLYTDGTARAVLPLNYNAAYFVTVKHRNSIAITSATPVSFSTRRVSLNLSMSPNVFGNNLKLIAGKYVVFGGDVNQDGIVDSGDMIDIDNAASGFTTGYIPPDANGDGLVDSGDMIMVDNNASDFITSFTP